MVFKHDESNFSFQIDVNRGIPKFTNSQIILPFISPTFTNKCHRDRFLSFHNHNITLCRNINLKIKERKKRVNIGAELVAHKHCII